MSATPSLPSSNPKLLPNININTTTTILTSKYRKMSHNPTRTPGAAHHTRTTSRASVAPNTAPPNKSRQLSHLHAQLAQLTANMSDLENLLRMTAVQAESMRGLGGYAGGM